MEEDSSEEEAAIPHKYTSEKIKYWMNMFDIIESPGDPIEEGMERAGAHQMDGQWVGSFSSFLVLVMNEPSRELQQMMDVTRKFREIYTLFDRDNEVCPMSISLTPTYRSHTKMFLFFIRNSLSVLYPNVSLLHMSKSSLSLTPTYRIRIHSFACQRFSLSQCV